MVDLHADVAAEDLEAMDTLNQLVPPVEEKASLLLQLEGMLELWPGAPGAGTLEVGEEGEHHERRFVMTSPWPGTRDNPVEGSMWAADEGLGGRRAVVALHPGFSSDLVAMRVLTRFVRDKGVDVYAPWAPWHGPRNHTVWPSGGPLVGTGAAGMILAVMQGEWETASLVLGLRQAGYRQVYLTGASLGGLVTALVASRVALDGAALLIPATDFQHQLWPAASKVAIAPEAFEVVQQGFDAIRAGRRTLCPQTPRQHVHVLAGTFDAVCRIEQVREFCNTWGLAAPEELPCGHLGFFKRWADARTRLSTWIS